MKNGWQVYLLECNDGTYYCGITTDLSTRLISHANGSGAKYTRGRDPYRVLAVTGFMSKSEASKIEAKIKSLKKDMKRITLLGTALYLEKIRLFSLK